MSHHLLSFLIGLLLYLLLLLLSFLKGRLLCVVLFRPFLKSQQHGIAIILLVALEHQLRRTTIVLLLLVLFHDSVDADLLRFFVELHLLQLFELERVDDSVVGHGVLHHQSHAANVQLEVVREVLVVRGLLLVLLHLELLADLHLLLLGLIVVVIVIVIVRVGSWSRDNFIQCIEGFQCSQHSQRAVKVDGFVHRFLLDCRSILVKVVIVVVTVRCWLIDFFRLLRSRLNDRLGLDRRPSWWRLPRLPILLLLFLLFCRR